MTVLRSFLTHDIYFSFIPKASTCIQSMTSSTDGVVFLKNEHRRIIDLDWRHNFLFRYYQLIFIITFMRLICDGKKAQFHGFDRISSIMRYIFIAFLETIDFCFSRTQFFGLFRVLIRRQLLCVRQIIYGYGQKNVQKNEISNKR